MEIEINLDNDIAVYIQIIDQVKQAVSTGSLTPGAPLPSIRQLANDLDLNSKTIAKAYKLLERDKIIESKRYRGSFIHPNAKEFCGTDILTSIEATLYDCINSLRTSGATDSEIRIVFNDIMTKNKA